MSKHSSPEAIGQIGHKPASPPRLGWFDLALVFLSGISLGIILLLAGWFVSLLAKRNDRLHVVEPVSGIAGPQLLLTAQTDDFDFRATGIDLQEGSPLLDAIMKQLPADIGELRARFDQTPEPPNRIDISYQRLVTAGPVTSLLRTERLIYPDGRSELSHATSLFNDIAPNRTDMRYMFRNYPGMASRLDSRLCSEITRQKVKRLGKDARFDCSEHELISFFDGPPSAFIRSDRRNLIGGLRFYFPAGTIGNPEEGRYVITLPQSSFHSELVPAYAGLFGGEPVALE